MSNMDLFDHYAARIFATVYEAFPEWAPVDCLKISEGKEDDYGRTPRETHICSDTLQWLCDSGYLRCGERSGHVRMATLTPKGLECLKAVPSSLEGNVSLGERLADTVKAGSRDAAMTLVRTLLTEGFRIIMR